MKADVPDTVTVNSRMRIFLRWVRYVLLGLLSLLVVLVCAGTVYEGIESHRDQRKYHPPGRLVDSSHPDQDERFPPDAKKLAPASYYVIRAMQITLPIGLPRLLASRAAPPEVRSEYCAVFCRRQFLAAVRAEAVAQNESSAQVRTLGSLGNLPLIVLSHDPDKMRFPGNLTEPVNREWGKMQEELAHLSSNGSHIVVKGSGHDIQIDHPEAVVDAIRVVVGKGKGR